MASHIYALNFSINQSLIFIHPLTNYPKTISIFYSCYFIQIEACPFWPLRGQPKSKNLDFKFLDLFNNFPPKELHYSAGERGIIWCLPKC